MPHEEPAQLRLIHEASRELASAGIALSDVQEVATGSFDANLRTEQRRYKVRLRTTVRPQTVRRHDDSNVVEILVVPRVTARRADYLRGLEINFMDALGNALLRLPGLIVDIRGRNPRNTDRFASTSPSNLEDLATSLAKESGEFGTHAKASLPIFTPRRSQVLFALLTWPDIVDDTIAQMARISGTSIGTVQQTLSSLQSANLLNPRGLTRGSELRRQWITAYPRSLAPRLALGTYAPMGGPSGTPHGALFGAEHMVRTQLATGRATYYVEEFGVRDAMKMRWSKNPTGNIEIRRQFWKWPANESTDTIPPLLAVADLAMSDDPRLREASAELWKATGLDAD